MKFEFKPSFDKSVKFLSEKDKEEIKELCRLLIDVLEKKRNKVKGIGLERLRKNFWEIRKGIKLRIIFRWQNDCVEFILTGSHDRVKKFLKENV